MHANFFGDVLDHHGAGVTQRRVRELRLTADNGLAGAQDGALTLLDVAHQLQGRAIALLHVILDVLLGAGLRQKLFVTLVRRRVGMSSRS